MSYRDGHDLDIFLTFIKPSINLEHIKMESIEDEGPKTTSQPKIKEIVPETEAGTSNSWLSALRDAVVEFSDELTAGILLYMFRGAIPP